ncbi:hypothetical protein [Campylobacter vicugnae]|uniref:Membrane protein n=1 Tax=Campylobacter vicugnae TaxID=1660076 RepID=A0A1X9T124_9BACT|nr:MULTISPECIES: hypothetical protein [unclassified Campylobacter]ARR02218.1 putative membrane protein [Campylobacter sp. RM8964]
MAELDKLKNDFELLKIALNTLIVVFIGVVSFAFVNFEKLSNIKLILISCLIPLLLILFIIVCLKIKQKQKDIKDTK